MKTIWTCFCAGDLLLKREGADSAFSLPIGEEPPVALKPWNIVTTLSPLSLGRGDDTEAKIVHLDAPVVGIDGWEMMGLRKTHAALSLEDYQLAGKAAELLYWDAGTKYCGVCGSPNKWMTDISKKCPECGKEWWPSASTAVIVRVRRKDEILLVRARNFRTNHYGLVAGFLETGESLEQCVERELHEEVGISITNLKYFGSQPWPYPFGLMVGFTADYAGGDIHLQQEELTEGGWFTRDNLPAIPDKASIARRLIDDWIEQA